jgi:predicted enzyme related to lactoylglutathione lyase
MPIPTAQPTAPGRRLAGALIGAVLALAGCAGTLSLPPLTQEPTGAWLPGKVVWHDLLSEDAEAARAFYGDLFGWRFEAVDPGIGVPYYLARHDGRPVAGLVDARGFARRVNVSRWIGVISVEDVDAAARTATAAGGRVIGQPQPVGGRGRMAVIKDPAGGIVALVRTTGGDPPDRPPATGDWLWNELWTADLDASARFYRRLAPYRVETFTPDDDGAPYRYLAAAGVPRAGLVPRPAAAIPTTWLPYILVDDIDRTAARAAALGGRLLAGPIPHPVGGRVALLADPSGAGFLVQTRPVRETARHAPNRDSLTTDSPNLETWLR